jgi:ATP-dependent RNA helicase DeaD
MLCRFGKLTRQDIGAIRMQQTETFVELAADAVERFKSSIGKDMALEKGIRVKALASRPDLKAQDRDDSRPPRAQKRFNEGNDRDKPRSDRGEFKPKGDRDGYKPKSDGGPAKKKKFDKPKSRD